MVSGSWIALMHEVSAKLCINAVSATCANTMAHSVAYIGVDSRVCSHSVQHLPGSCMLHVNGGYAC